jgi:hypothetical protein
MRKYISWQFQSLLLFAFLLASSIPIASSARAAEMDAAQKAALDKALQGTMRNSPPTDSDVKFDGDPRIPQIPAFSWQKGQAMADAYPASVGLLLGAGKFSPETAISAAGQSVPDLENASLGELKFLEQTSLKDVLTANPQLINKKIGDIPGWSGNASTTLGELSKTSAGNLPIPDEVLKAASVKDLDGISKTLYSAYPEIGKLKIADLPGVQDIPWNKLITSQAIPPTMQVMKFDKLLTGQKKLNKDNGSNVASGSNKEPHAPCENCDAVELRSILQFGSPTDTLNAKNPLNGSLSLIGQKLKGGEGLLGDIMTAAGVREPGGFEVPYIGIGSCGSKWSAESPDAKKGSFQQQLNFRMCYYDTFLGFQATPYFIPIPLPLPATEKEANVLLPMIVSPIAFIRSTPSVSSAVNGLTSGLTSSVVPSIAANTPSIPTNGVSPMAALFGTATKNSCSPVQGICTSGT